jgi:hypothetical protein
MRLLEFTLGCLGLRVHAASLGSYLRRGSDRLPSGQALKNALGILHRVNMPVVCANNSILDSSNDSI